jgi:hypothetical protein
MVEPEDISDALPGEVSTFFHTSQAPVSDEQIEQFIIDAEAEMAGVLGLASLDRDELDPDAEDLVDSAVRWSAVADVLDKMGHSSEDARERYVEYRDRLGSNTALIPQDGSSATGGYTASNVGDDSDAIGEFDRKNYQF